MGALNDRCNHILNALLWETDYISLQYLVDEIKVSKRSIYYDICRINEWLDQKSITEITIERGKGILIPTEDKKKIKQLLLQEEPDSDYYFQPSERVKIIIMFIFYSRVPVYIDQLLECCQVSRNTIFGDLRVVVNTLHEYDLELEYESKKGYRIGGDAVRARAVFFLLFSELRRLYEKDILTFLPKEIIEEHLGRLEVIEKELRMHYVDGCLLGIAVMMPIISRNSGKLYFPGLRKNEIEQTAEYHIVEKYYTGLEENEKIYLTLHLLGARTTTSSEDIFENSIDESVYGITKSLVTEFEKISCVNFEDREQLERDLFVHISSSMYRYQYGIQVGNPLCQDIMREYPHVFQTTRIVCKYLERMIGIPMLDSEVAFLAMHFGAHLKVVNKKDEDLRVLIVCANGVSIGNMLKREVQNLLPNVQIVGVAAAMDLVNVQDICDLIISAIPIPCLVPVIVVHSVLTEEDRNHILKHSLILNHNKIDVEKSLFDIVRRYVPDAEQERVKAEITHCLRGNLADESRTLWMRNGLLDQLDFAMIYITEEKFLWQDSIRYAGKELVQKKYITNKYLDTIISQTSYYGTYMFLNEKVMLAHAKPEDGVLHMGIQMTVFKNPVEFSNNHFAEIIFVLAAEDQEKHLNMLNDIFKLVENGELLEQIVKQDTVEDIMYSMKKSLV
ncbi:MAG: BglG family transcription antiterminator [Lachnospiraceae bacterium]|nr:BglG family transcription antiterminator [Lachnospiraceae bacterium]